MLRDTVVAKFDADYDVPETVYVTGRWDGAGDPPQTSSAVLSDGRDVALALDHRSTRWRGDGSVMSDRVRYRGEL
jgi:hypothetical protein